jgi:hypothetical membrane protein
MQPDAGITRPHLCGTVRTDEARVFGVLALIQATTLPLSIVTYPGRFRLAESALSDLGLAVTPDGAGNAVSRVIFAANFVLTAYVMLSYARSCSGSAPVNNARLKRTLALAAALGAIVAIAPHDRFHSLHGVGCGALIGSLWMIANLLAGELWRAERGIAVISQAVLQTTVLSYALAYALDAPQKQLLQKLAVAGLSMSLALAGYAVEGCRPARTVLVTSGSQAKGHVRQR